MLGIFKFEKSFCMQWDKCLFVNDLEEIMLLKVLNKKTKLIK